MEWLVPCRTAQIGRTDQVILMVTKSFDSQKIAAKVAAREAKRCLSGTHVAPETSST